MSKKEFIPVPISPEEQRKHDEDIRVCKEAVLDEHLGYRFSDFLGDPFRISWVPWQDRNGGTACWCFYKSPSPGHHRIRMGEGLLKNLKVACRKKGEAGEYAKRFYRHEVAHGLFTLVPHPLGLTACKSSLLRNIEAFNATLSEVSCPFGLWNLFEDARIEECWRRLTGGKFGWLDYEEPARVDLVEKKEKTIGGGVKEVVLFKRPSSYFFACIQSEIGSGAGDRDPVAEFVPGLVKEAREISESAIVKDFYRRAIGVKTVEAQLALMREWIARFPDDDATKGNQGFFSMNATDMGAALSYAMEAAGFGGVDVEEAITGAGLSEGIDADSYRDSGDIKEGFKPVNPKDCGSAHDKGEPFMIAKSRVVELDHVQVAELTQKFMRVMKGTESRERSISPTNRFSMRAHVRNSTRKFVRKCTGVDRNKKKGVLVIDTSGSMGGGHHRGGLTLLSVLNNLARAGRVDMSVILTGGIRRPASYRAKLPVPPALIEQISANGGMEGFHGTFKAWEAELLGADFVWCYTDGRITDTALDKAGWNARGLETFGLYVGNEGAVSGLKEYFDHVIVRGNIVDLCDEILRMVKKHNHT